MEGQPTRESIDDQVEGTEDEGRRAADVAPPIADDAKKGQTETPAEPGDVGVPTGEQIRDDEDETQ
jgi:hypothetical protein